MKHPRTLIREAVAALLSANLPKVDDRITPARISIHRSTPLFAAKLPAILIYTRDERIEAQPNADPGLRYRKLELSVEIITSGDLAAEDADALASAVEFVMEINETLGNTVEGTRLTRTEVDQGGEGDTPILALRMNFTVSYWTQVPELPVTNPKTPTVQLPAPELDLADLVAWARQHVASGGVLSPDVIATWQQHLDETWWQPPSQVLGSWVPKIGAQFEPAYGDINAVKGDVVVPEGDPNGHQP